MTYTHVYLYVDVSMRLSISRDKYISFLASTYLRVQLYLFIL